MKFRIFTLVSLLFSIAAYGQSVINNFTLKGKIVGQNTGFIHISYLDITGKWITDSCKLDKGKFKFKGRISEPTFATINGIAYPQNVDASNATEIFIEPASMKAVFNSNNFMYSKITGSISQNDFATYHHIVDSLDNKWNTVLSDLALAKTQHNKAKTDSISETQMPLYRVEKANIDKLFIKAFPDSYVSARYLKYRTVSFPIDSIKSLFASLSPKIQQSRDGKQIADFIIKTENIAIGKTAPDFKQPDNNGNNVSLSYFKGKYVLLDFWASWCGPCREEHPYLKQAYAKYHDKGFTIIGLSLDELKYKDKWLKAIEEDGLTWTQVCDFTFMKNTVLDQYNLVGKGIPANFLISPDGKILAMDLRGGDLEKKLAEFIK